ncbi:MAG: ATP-binding cassette domain-containing protein [Pseudoclavibacter sp.]
MIEIDNVTKSYVDRKVIDRVSSYSLGKRQRLGLAVALVGDAEVLIMDEPTNGLDPAGIRWLRQLLDELADHVVVISNGSVDADGALAELAGDHDLETVIFDLTGDEQ